MIIVNVVAHNKTVQMILCSISVKESPWHILVGKNVITSPASSWGCGEYTDRDRLCMPCYVRI